MSGVIVYVKSELMKYVKRLYNECDFGIILQFGRGLFGFDKSTVVCFIYLPPDNSPFYDDNDTDGIGFLENLIIKFNTLNEDVNIVILGDLNARMADRNDFICESKIVPALEEYEEYLTDYDTKTNSVQNFLNFVRRI